MCVRVVELGTRLNLVAMGTCGDVGKLVKLLAMIPATNTETRVDLENFVYRG